MSKADIIFREMCKDILENGFSSEGQGQTGGWDTCPHNKKVWCRQPVRPVGGVPDTDFEIYESQGGN